jgi:hypothetical protein
MALGQRDMSFTVFERFLHQELGGILYLPLFEQQQTNNM